MIETLSADAPGAKRSRWWTVALVGLLAWSAALRLWYMAPDPTPDRWWDEGFNEANVCGILADGELRPRNFWYGSLSYLPQTAVLWAVDATGKALGREGLVLHSPTRMTALSRWICRGMQVAYGVASLWVVFVLGRELFGRQAGLLGALILAASPRHVHASAIFKPDVLLLLTSVLALLWGIRAIRAPGPRSYLEAGLGIGLATATKLNGVTIAVPLVVGALLPSKEGWRRWLRLAVAAGVAALVYLAINPYLVATLRYLNRNREHYRVLSTGSHLDVLAATSGFLFGPNFHGPFLGLVAVAGAALLVRKVWRGGVLSEASRPFLMFLSYPLVYTLIYAVATTRAKENHFLQLLPFSSLLAAFALVAGWEWGSRRLAESLRLRLLGAAAGVLGAWLLLSPFAWVYAAVVPTTSNRVAADLRGSLTEPLKGRLVVAEAGAGPLSLQQGQLPSAVQIVDRLSEVESRALDLADAEVFPRRRLEEDQNSFYLERQARNAGAAVRGYASRWFHASGPDLVVLEHAWDFHGESPATGEPLAAATPGTLSGRLTLDLSPGEVASLAVTVARKWKDSKPVRLRVGTRELPLAPAGRTAKHFAFVTPRFDAEAGAEPFVLELQGPAPDPRAVQVSLFRWSRPTSPSP